MCGIAGFTGKPNQQQLQTMLNIITHRGPDDDAGLQTENFSMGMRRLAIIDLSKNLYPVMNADQSIFVVFNGEIYNYRTVREELIAAGYKFTTNSDSEVIVHAYEHWGVHFVQKMRGMFTIAIYDKNKDEMLLFRDRLGIKPLYYAEVNGKVLFASEIKALVAIAPELRQPNDAAVIRFLVTRIHDDSKDTFFYGIKRVPAGHYMQIDSQGNYRFEKYWNPSINTKFKSEKSDREYAEELRRTFVESMRLHMISDVPLGVGLSGGLDSSGVTGTAAKLLEEGSNTHTDNKLLTFSAVHPGKSIDESHYIDKVAEFANATSIKVSPSVDEFWNQIDKWLYYQEEPTISTAPYAYYTVMEEASRHVKVLLSGQGGDELFAGYIPYIASYVSTAREAKQNLRILQEFRDGFDMYYPHLKKRFTSRFSGKKLSMLNMMTAPAKQLLRELELGHSHSKNLNERLFFDITQGSVPALLRYEDKNSMAHSLESRVPFLDHKVVEYALSLPAEQKIKKGWNRYVYRNAMAELMPEENRWRRSKVGFVNMEWEWMKEKAELISKIFQSDKFRSRPYWDANQIHKEFLLAVKGKRQGDWLIFWRILSVELWMRSYIDEFEIRSYK